MRIKGRVLDMSILLENNRWQLYIPIATGHLQVVIPVGENIPLDQFLETALLSPSRRFGENPQ